jgi:hypothetical protein
LVQKARRVRRSDIIKVASRALVSMIFKVIQNLVPQVALLGKLVARMSEALQLLLLGCALIFVASMGSYFARYKVVSVSEILSVIANMRGGVTAYRHGWGETAEYLVEDGRAIASFSYEMPNLFPKGLPDLRWQFERDDLPVEGAVFLPNHGKVKQSIYQGYRSVPLGQKVGSEFVAYVSDEVSFEEANRYVEAISAVLLAAGPQLGRTSVSLRNKALSIRASGVKPNPAYAMNVVASCERIAMMLTKALGELEAENHVHLRSA